MIAIHLDAIPPVDPTVTAGLARPVVPAHEDPTLYDRICSVISGFFTGFALCWRG